MPDSPSPLKRTRQDAATSQAHQEAIFMSDLQPSNQSNGASTVVMKSESGTEGYDLPNFPTHSVRTSNVISQALLQPNSTTHAAPALPPFPPTLKSDPFIKTTPQTSSAFLPLPHSGLQPPQPTSQLRISSILPPTPDTAERHMALAEMNKSPPRQLSLELSQPASRRPLTNSASEPQEYPIKVGVKTLRTQIELVRTSFGKVDVNNWIAHACFIASDLDQARRLLKDDLYATDEAFLTGRDLEQILAARGFTPQRVDTFINKVLNVLDGIAMADEVDDAEGASKNDSILMLEADLVSVLEKYPDQTKEAVASAATVTEYLVRGKEAQERKRLEVERRVKVLEGMVRIGEVVGGVVRFLLSEDKT